MPLLDRYCAFLQLAGSPSAHALHRPDGFAVVGTVALAAMITLPGDPYTLAMMSIPIYVFYEASIVVGLLLTRGRPRAATAPPD